MRLAHFLQPDRVIQNRLARDIYLNIVGEQKHSVMSTLRPVGPVAFENSREQTAPRNRLKESGTNPREI